MAAATSCCLALRCNPKTFTLQHSSNNSRASLMSSQALIPLSFSSNLSLSSFPRGDYGVLSAVVKSGSGSTRRGSVVCEAKPAKKADSAKKRARQAEKRRIYNKAKKSEIKTRMRKVLEALDELKKKSEAQSEEIFPIEKLIGEAYSAIDKAVKSGTLHRNTGARRKSRLARRKKVVEIHHGWYTPVVAA